MFKCHGDGHFEVNLTVSMVGQMCLNITVPPSPHQCHPGFRVSVQVLKPFHPRSKLLYGNLTHDKSWMPPNLKKTVNIKHLERGDLHAEHRLRGQLYSWKLLRKQVPTIQVSWEWGVKALVPAGYSDLISWLLKSIRNNGENNKTNVFHYMKS